MSKEIERKFLVKDDAWKQHVYRRFHIEQGYLCNDDGTVVRIRLRTVADRMRLVSEAFITIKGRQAGLTRAEYEYSIPAEDGMQLLDMCKTPNINKMRHIVVVDGNTWEIDVFLSGINDGLVLAEIELQDEDQQVVLPDWIGREVTHEIDYCNAYLGTTKVSTK